MADRLEYNIIYRIYMEHYTTWLEYLICYKMWFIILCGYSNINHASKYLNNFDEVVWVHRFQ